MLLRRAFHAHHARDLRRLGRRLGRFGDPCPGEESGRQDDRRAAERYDVGFTTLLQRLTPPDLQGRVYAAADTLVTTPQTVSIAVGAGLIGVTGYQPLLAALAVVVALAAAYLLTRPEQRQPEQRQPRQSQPAAQAGGGVTSS